MSTEPAKLLKLRAGDSEDIQVISAVLQDAIAPVCDMAFEAEQNTFVLVVQRLRREAGETGAAERICSALTIKGVSAVQTLGIDLQKADRMLDLLAILLEGTSEEGGKYLNFVFAGDGKIRLDLTDWAAALEDFGEAWPAFCNPCHEGEMETQQAKG